MPFFWCVAVSCQDESWGRWEPPKARFALAFFSFFFTPVRSGTGAAAQPAGTSGGTSQPSAGAVVAGRTAEGFFLGGVRGDPCLRGGGTGAGPRTGEGATLFFSGLGGTRKPVLQVELMKEIASQARFPSFFSPFLGRFSLVRPHAWRSWRRPCGARNFQARCRSSSPPPCPPVAPRQADAVALRRELEQLKAHPSAVEIDRLRFRARAPRRRLRSVAEAEDPLAVVFPLFFRSIPRRSVSPARPSTSASTWKKRSGPRPFFWGVFSSAERALRSAERALRSAERAQCRAGT